jgi:hypothetical protein
MEHKAHLGRLTNAYKILEGKPEVRPRSRRQDNIQIDLRKVEFEDVDSIHVAQDRVCLMDGCCEHGNGPVVSIKSG